MKDTVYSIHNQISDAAAALANDKANFDPRVPDRFLNVWSGTRNGEISIQYDAHILELNDPDLRSALHEIGLAAVKEVLVKRTDLFVGAILGSARKRQNYFDVAHSEVN